MATARSSPGHQAGCGCSACASSRRCGRVPRARCPASPGTSCWARPRRPRPPSRSCLPCSNLRHVHGLGTLVPSLLVVRHLGVLLQRLEPGAVHTGVVDEKVTIALVRRDEPVALLVVEPLDRTSGHTSSFPSALTTPGPVVPSRSRTCFRIRSGYRAKSTTLSRGKSGPERPALAALERGLARALL